jgi:ribonuclease D
VTAEFIQSLTAWEYFTLRLEGARVLALSVEDSSMRAYRSQVCLVQLHAQLGDGTALLAVVDALAFERLRPNPLTRLATIGSHGTQVVVHGGEYALAGLKRDLHIHFDEVADTQQAAVLLGWEQTGYRNLCQSLFAAPVTPAPSVDWRLRPLPDATLQAALDDVRWLPALHDALATRIDAADLRDEWRLAGRAVAATAPHANLHGPENIWHAREARGVPADRAHLLEALVVWRDRKAREFDCPPGKVVPNPQLCRIAAVSDPGRLDGLLQGFHSRLLWSDREEVRRLCLGYEPTSEPAPDLVSPPTAGSPPGPLERARVKRLKEWRRTEAQRRGVGLQAVLPAEAMAHLARFGVAGLANAPQFGEARERRYAEALTALLVESR